MTERRPRDEFTEAEYEASAKTVVDYAAEHGRAQVVRPDGTMRVVISIPPADLMAIYDADWLLDPDELKF